ncbi:hypothetical protein C8J57DRAFT_1534214 [Mycena rebaudengoi]|nr:hypothetical protein C8J57DRAFT_1534214 [Mycena rebaudengoi]
MTRFRPPTSEHPQPKGYIWANPTENLGILRHPPRPPHAISSAHTKMAAPCPFLTTPHTPDSAHPTSQTSPNTLAFRSGSAPCYISVRSGTFRSRAPEHLPTCRQLVLPIPRTALRTTLRSAPNLTCAQSPLRTCAPPCAPAPNLPAHLRTCAQLPCAPALNPCAPALRNFPDQSSADLPTTPPTRTPHAPAPTRAPALNTCALRTQPPSQPPSPMRLPPTAPPAPPPASPARLAPAPAP